MLPALDAAVGKSLPRFFEDIHIMRPVAGRPCEVDHLPNGRTTLVLRVLEESGKGDLTVAGPRTRAYFKSTTAIPCVVMLRFKPGWSATALGVAANELTDRIVPLEDIWGRAGTELGLELLDAPSVPEVVHRLARTLTLRTQNKVEPASAALARRAVRLLEGEEARVERVAARLGVTPRHLRRVFTESVGIAPKEFARVVRLQRVLRRTESSSDWSRIAADVGYYDQAHLIADFRDLVGLTPGAFLKRARSRCTGASAAAGPRADVARSPATSSVATPERMKSAQVAG